VPTPTPTPTPIPGPVGGQIVVAPNPVHQNLDGSFAASLVGFGLPPNIDVTIDLTHFGCGIGGSTFITTDALGGFNTPLFSTGGCLPGSHPIVADELTPPLASFIVLVQLLAL
jgi:hypothetical protein